MKEQSPRPVAGGVPRSRGQERQLKQKGENKMNIRELADAISLGATLHPQGTGTYYNRETNTTCGMGAALEAMGVSITTLDPPQLWGICQRLWPGAYEGSHECPIKGCRRGRATVVGMVVHLNDYPHHWTRERIAAWVATVATVEPRDEQRVDTCATTQPVEVEVAG